MQRRLALGAATAAAAVLAAAGAAPSDVRFVDATAPAGVDFAHVNGMVGERWLVEIMGAGAAVLDFDGDGLLDLYLVQGGPLQNRGGELPCDRLYRQVGDGRLRFEDVTARAGVCADGYGMGVAVGDIDNDGDPDLFVANFGPNQLLENLGDGRWRDITSTAGVAGDSWSVSASFADVDGDGRLDLYVGNYLDFAFATRKRCTDDLSRPSYCSPEVYAPAQDRLFRNLGGGRFADVSAPAGMQAARGPALGVVARDFDGDGRRDIFVANDMADNFLWMNRGDGTFEDNALFAGVAVNGDGMAEASMGVAARDFDEDCDLDLFLTHLAVQTNTLYVNNGRGWFTDRSNVAGVAAASIPDTGFGTAWFDADNDGDLDLFSANGAVTAIAGQAPGPLDLPLRQPNRLWLNDGGRYRAIKSVSAFDVEEVSRGTALGDLDNDGDLDLVVANNRGPARIYRNDAAGGHWLGVALAAGESPTPTAGSEVRLESVGSGEGERCLVRHVARDGSYGSANDPRAHFGLGADARSRSVLVTWPDGATERFGPLAVDRYHTLQRQRGADAAAAAPVSGGQSPGAAPPSALP